MPAANLDKRRFLRQFCCCGALAGAGGLLAGRAKADNGIPKTRITGDEALELLKSGNARYVAGSPMRPAQDQSRRTEIALVQSPIAAVIGCSDSRVPPELLFGRGLGEIFTVRNAGNTIDHAAEGSLEYAVVQLGVPLIVVLGHERCGAVDAAMAVVESNATFPGNIGSMIEPIIPAVLKAKSVLIRPESGETARPYTAGALLDLSVDENIKRVAGHLLSAESLLSESVSRKKLTIVGARYDLDEGRVRFFSTVA